MANKFTQAIRHDQTMYGLWGRMTSVMAAEILSQTGLGFMIMDMEHGAVDIADLRSMVPVYKASGTPILLRIASPKDSYVAKALDLGVDGIVVPQVKTAEEAKRAVLASKFAPLGERGLGGACPADRFGDVRVEEFIKQENERVMTIIQIENAEASEQLDDILKAQAKRTPSRPISACTIGRGSLNGSEACRKNSDCHGGKYRHWARGRQRIIS